MLHQVIRRSGYRGSSSTSEPPAYTIREVGQFIGQNRFILIMSLVIPIGAALVYLMTAEPVFTARAQLLLDPSTPQPMQVSLNGQSSYDSPQIESQIAVLKSENTALTVARKLNLWSDPEFFGIPKEPGAPDTTDPSVANPRDTPRVLGSIISGLDARRVGVSYAIDISYSSRIPEKAAKIANAFAEAFVQDQLSARAEAVRTGGEWLEGRIDQLRQQMNAAAQRVQEFRVKRDYRIGARQLPTDASTSYNSSQQVVQGQVVEPQTRPPEPLATEPEAKQDPHGDKNTSLDELESTSQTYKRIYESYLQAYAESVQRQSFPVANARIITEATVPLDRSKPKTNLVLALAGMLGLIAGFGIALLKQNFLRDASQGNNQH